MRSKFVTVRLSEDLFPEVNIMVLHNKMSRVLCLNH